MAEPAQPVVVTTTTTTTDQQQPPPPQPQQQPAQTNYVAVQVTEAPGVGQCPKCHNSNLVETCNTCAIVLAILFFPLGLIAIFTIKDKKCPACGYREKGCC